MKAKLSQINLKLLHIIVFILICGLLFSRAMNSYISHDEYQFVASAQLLVSRGLLPYIDYPYLHMPYMVFFNSIPVAQYLRQSA